MRITKYRTELVKEAAFNYEATDAISAKQVNGILQAAFNASARPEEHIWQVCVNAKGRCVGLFELAAGSQTSCIVDPAGLIRNALLCNAYAFIMAHNHPSGDPTPSGEDISSTKRVQQAADIIGIKLWDHVIIGDGSFCSLSEQGIM